MALCSNAHELMTVTYPASLMKKAFLDKFTVKAKGPGGGSWGRFLDLLNPFCRGLWKEAALQVWLREEPRLTMEPNPLGSSEGWREVKLNSDQDSRNPLTKSAITVDQILPCSVYQGSV